MTDTRSGYFPTWSGMREAKYQWTALAAASHMLLCVLTVVAMSAFEPGAFRWCSSWRSAPAFSRASSSP